MTAQLWRPLGNAGRAGRGTVMSGERGITVSLPYFRLPVVAAARRRIGARADARRSDPHRGQRLGTCPSPGIFWPTSRTGAWCGSTSARTGAGISRTRSPWPPPKISTSWFRMPATGVRLTGPRYCTKLSARATRAPRFPRSTSTRSAVVSGPAAARPAKLSFANCTQAPRPRLVPISHQAGLYRTEALRAIGGCYGGFRSGYGTLLAGLMALTARLAYLDVPLYHRPRRRSPPAGRTGPGTDPAARRAVRARLDGLYHEAYRGFCEYTSGRRSLGDLCLLTSALVAANVTAPDARELAAQSARLRAQLAPP